MSTRQPPQYRPTALEQAHACHLLQTHFETPHHTPIINDNLRLSGRQAVPFLTTSNIERTLLRLFWSVVDPESVGTLLTRNQFHVLLRLVAMAQAHFLPPLTDDTMVDGDKIELLIKALNDNSHLVIALPTFSADTDCPSVAYLLGTYSSRDDTTEYQSGSGDVSSMMMNHDLQYQLWQQNQQQQQLDSSQGVHMMSVSDAFGSLPEVEDRPLPSLQVNTNAETTIEDAKLSQADVEVENGESNGIIAVEDETRSNTIPNNEDFGDFSGGNNPMQTNQEMAISGFDSSPNFIENEGDDFGAFEESTPHGTNNDSDIKTESSESLEDNAADFGDFSDTFAPAGAVTEPTLQETDDVRSSVDLVAKENDDSVLGANVEHTLSVSDAFASLGNQEDTPIQIGQFDGLEGAHGDENIVEESGHAEEEIDDDFGNFGSASTAAAPSLMEEKANDEFAPEHMKQNSSASSFGMSAFDAFGDVEDKPLPPLGGISSATNVSEAAKSAETEENDDDFGLGSFEATVEIEQNDITKTPANDDSFGNFEGAEVTSAIAEQNSDFGMFEDAVQEIADSTVQIIASQVEDSFGSFGEAQDGVETIRNDQRSEIPTACSDIPPVSEPDPFDSLPEVENLPLPPLQSPFVEEKKSIEAPEAENEGDEFGDFGGVPIETDLSNGYQSSPSEIENGEQTLASQVDTIAEQISELESNDFAADDDFGAFGDSSTTPPQVHNTLFEVVDSEQVLPSPAFDSSKVQSAEEKKSHEDEDIGVAPTNEDNLSDKDTKSPLGMSAFDAFGDVEDAPLPPLSDFTPVVDMSDSKKLEKEEDESFGEFGASTAEENVPAPSSSMTETLIDASVEDSFGAFEGTPEEIIDPIEIEESPAEDSFGTFEDADNNAESSQKERNVDNDDQVEDSFGSFGGVDETTKEENVESIGDDEAKAISAQVKHEDNPSLGLPSPSPSDPFGSLPEIENLPLPPLGSPQFVEKKMDDVVSGVDETTQDFQTDDFGDFDSVPVHPNNGGSGLLSNDSTLLNNGKSDMLSNESTMDVSDFGGFESSAAQLSANEDMIAVATDATDNESNTVSESQVPAENDDDFGDFGEAEVPSFPVTKIDEEDFGETQAHTFQIDTNLQAVETEERDTEDDFGDFVATEVPASSEMYTGNETNIDDGAFGDFGEAQVSSSSVVETVESVYKIAMDNTEDDFGAFGAAEVPASSGMYTGNETIMDEDVFGDFGGAQVSSPSEVEAMESANEAAIDNTDDDFVDFGEAQVPGLLSDAAATRTDETKEEEIDGNNFGEFDGSKAPASELGGETNFGETVTDDAEDDFGDFGDAQVSLPTDKTLMSTHTEGDFGFGDWGSGNWQEHSTSNEPDSSTVPDILTNGFDAFSDAAQEPAAALDEQLAPKTPSGESYDDFGDFEAPKSNVTQEEGSEGFIFVENAESNGNDQSDDFGDFSSPASNFNAFDPAADEEKIMQPKLEEEDAADDFGDFSSFDDSAKQPTEVKAERQPTSFSRRELIENEYSSRLERWTNVASTIKSDVTRGQKIIEYITKSLPKSDRAVIFKSSKLRNHILGLGEYVRIMKCIAATIADLFCLSEVIDIKPECLTEWNDNPIIVDAIAIDTSWSDIIQRAIELDILSEPPHIESVAKIRKRAEVATIQQKSDLCNLTLQPFVEEQCTQSSVSFDGDSYMACAANFLANNATRV